MAEESNKRQKNDFHGKYTSGGSQFIDHTRDQAILYRECLQDLHHTDPRVDKRRIEANKDRLLEGSCSWVAQDTAFQSWWAQDDPQLLWIHGDAGKGKTMMMLALYAEISRRIEQSDPEAVVVYFFCQNTDPRLNNAAAVLRGLIFHLVVQDQHTLLDLLRKALDEMEKALEGPILIHALFRILTDLSLKSRYARVYLMIDALDECASDLITLLIEITESGYHSHKIKWLVTSRNESQIQQHLSSDNRPCLSLELNSDHVSRAVRTYIDAKVTELARRKGYKRRLISMVKEYLSSKADGTFLWVSLVCKELMQVRALDAKEKLRKFPSGLVPVYERILEQLSAPGVEDPQRHLSVLRLVTIAFRPLHVNEIVPLGGLPYDPEYSEDLVESCGSFLTIRDKKVYFIHQSAAEFFKCGKGSVIFLPEESDDHLLLAYRCLQLMSSALRRNVCKLSRPDASSKDITEEQLENHLPTSIQYSVQYCIKHLYRGQASSERCRMDEAKVVNFFQSVFLLWLEASGVIQCIADIIYDITNLQVLLSVSRN
ncbi:hypothetical protein BP5796_09975 [Coleophoma crateriformis]|uniref:NACHT domain-containing protein n=1 Tax=Coleophoma crateriformis TaxID=565419 RepID=A0A3D8QTW8_9HELO|nr:hypothetical protein BP5796_09975 [Coleophoma crateriformis]